VRSADFGTNEKPQPNEPGGDETFMTRESSGHRPIGYREGALGHPIAQGLKCNSTPKRGSRQQQTLRSFKRADTKSAYSANNQRSVCVLWISASRKSGGENGVPDLRRGRAGKKKNQGCRISDLVREEKKKSR